ncbi:STAS domain-containing protein [Pseudooceanicola marinus]|uniref:STAS domain-containing protein n=1 Tax=Pseudooceanicola marinus TaxID=396013 RepID=UPI001C97960D|nr:STAS domain-containing protein [Pseudooceanicola marinus]MBY5974105.1 STAS domain-containing protein [Ferrimonas balearica]MCA1334353.1 STAS domain-containing protein [Pseudooceanicola marinus]
MTEPLVLQPKLDLPAAAPLAEALRGRLDGDVVLDGSQVTQVGALCLQVMLSAATSLRSKGHAMSLTNLSDKVVEQLAQMGFSPETLAEGRG